MNTRMKHLTLNLPLAALAALALGTAANAAMIDNPNLVNGDFESGGTGWTVSDPSGKNTGVDFTPGIAQSGDESAEFLFGDGFQNNGAELTQTVTIPTNGIGQLHSISFWHRQLTTDTTGEWAKWQIRVSEGTTDLLSIEGNTIGNGQTWAQETFTFTPSGSSIEILFKDKRPSKNEKRTPFVDNVQLTYEPIPEPATLALLGLGGAVMLSGRKRR